MKSNYKNVKIEDFFKDRKSEDHSKTSNNDKKLEEIIYNSIETDGFKAVSVENGKIYVVVD